MAARGRGVSASAPSLALVPLALALALAATAPAGALDPRVGASEDFTAAGKTAPHPTPTPSPAPPPASEELLRVAHWEHTTDRCVVYTYYAELGTAWAPAALQQWRRSWAAAGWKPRVLREAHASAHPKYAAFREVYAAMPTPNDGKYELACYVRHLAVAAVGGGCTRCMQLVALESPCLKWFQHLNPSRERNWLDCFHMQLAS
jgi:hypothetical protein